LALSLVNVALGKSAFQWSLLSRKGIMVNVARVARNDSKNAAWGGAGTVSGTIKIGAVAAKRRVRLYEAGTGVLVREQWSEGDGSYSFTGLNTGYRYTVTSTDFAGNYNDVIAANITAV
jgi:hypothetical protein